MAEFLFISPEEMTTTTVLGGNVDVDKYIFCIAQVQITTIEKLLGSELYEKIKTEAESETLAGDYLILYTDYVKPITKNEATAQYIEIASYMVTNGGIYKHTADNSEVVTKDEAMTLAQKYSAIAQMYVQRFEKWICKHHLPEYKCHQDKVNPDHNMKLTGGWKL